MNKIDKEISERLKNEILTCGKSKSQIADELGISRPTLSQYLSGKIFPSLGTCKVVQNIRLLLGRYFGLKVGCRPLSR